MAARRETGPACGNTRPMATGQVTKVPLRGDGIAPALPLDHEAGDAQRCAVTSLQANGGNNDAAALDHVAQVAAKSLRRAKLLVMVSDGLPTECSVAALKGVVHQLSRRHSMCCAQVAVRELDERCFPHYVVLDDANLDLSVRRFGDLIGRLVGRAITG